MPVAVYLVKSALLDTNRILLDNRTMPERIQETQLSPAALKIISDFKLGTKMEFDGYEDIGQPLQWSALDVIKDLPKEERIRVKREIGLLLNPED